MPKELLIIFVRTAIEGKVKTRLANSVGDRQALSIYKKLIENTHRITVGLKQKKWVCYSGRIPENDLWEDEKFDKHIQEGSDLGYRMNNAFLNGFDTSHENICLIGSDILELTEDIIGEAFQLLHQHDLVIGPAQDGGYYLIGMKKPHQFLFEEISWSSDKVLSKTIKKAEDNNLSIGYLPILNDIDTLADIRDEDRNYLLS